MHYILKHIKNDLILLKNYKSVIEEASLKENFNYDIYKGNIDWSLVEHCFIMDWGNIDSATIIQKLESSILTNYQYLYLQIGYEEDTMSISSQVFISNWEEILHASVEGFPLMTPDKKFYFEFLQNPKVIYSNFKI